MLFENRIRLQMDFHFIAQVIPISFHVLWIISFENFVSCHCSVFGSTGHKSGVITSIDRSNCMRPLLLKLSFFSYILL